MGQKTVTNVYGSGSEYDSSPERKNLRRGSANNGRKRSLHGIEEEVEVNPNESRSKDEDIVPLRNGRPSRGIRPEIRHLYNMWCLVCDSYYQQRPILSSVPLVPAQTSPKFAKEILKRRLAAAEKEKEDALAALVRKKTTVLKLKEEICALEGGGAGEETKTVMTIRGVGCLL